MERVKAQSVMMSSRKRSHLSIPCGQSLKKWQRDAMSYSKETTNAQGVQKCDSKETETQARYGLSPMAVLKDIRKRKGKKERGREKKQYGMICRDSMLVYRLVSDETPVYVASYLDHLIFQERINHPNLGY